MEQIITNDTWCSHFGKEQIQSMAETFHKALFWKCQNLMDCVKLLKGSLIIDSKSHDFSLAISQDKSFKIFRSFPYSTFRDNFTIAHELGHYFVHFLNQYHTNDYYTNPLNEYEVVFKYCDDNFLDVEANWFALAFLMPKEEFISMAKKYDISVHIPLAAHFNVSENAVALRKKDLGLI